MRMLSIDLYVYFREMSYDFYVHDNIISISLDVHSRPLWAKTIVVGYDSIYAFDSHAVLSILRICGIHVRVQ